MKLSGILVIVAAISTQVVVGAPAAVGERGLLSTISGILSSSLVPGLTISTDHKKAGPIVAYILKNSGAISKNLFSKSLPWISNQAQASKPWSQFKANGVNLGGWMELENSITPEIFEKHGSPPDEWTLCGNLGASCAEVLEQHYATYFTRSSIDLYAKYGINTLRVPTTYQAWVNVPGSQLYHGNQQRYLSDVLEYAVQVYGMKVIIGLHSLPGGVNSLDIGEALFHKGWFNNATNLDYSFQAVQGVLAFISKSSNPLAYAISPLNEASDDLSKFGSPNGLSDAGVDWVNTYLRGVLKLISASKAPRTTMFVQDCFKGPAFFAPFYPSGSNIVIDSHIYFFAAAGAYGDYLAPSACGEAKYYKDLNVAFPIYVGEWSLQSQYNNTFAGRKLNYQTQAYAYSHYLQGGSSWNAKHNSSVKVDGQGVQSDYWSLEKLIAAGVVNEGGKLDSVYCSD